MRSQPVFRKIGESGIPRKSKTGVVQDYTALKALHNATNKFEDPEFPCEKESSGFSQIKAPSYWNGQSRCHPSTPWGETWARPAELVKILSRNDPNAKATFAGPKYSRFNVQQGMLGDCWYVSSLALLATKPAAFKICIPEDNRGGFDAGIFHFRFRYRGTWMDIVVDDRLPWFMDMEGKPSLALINVDRVGNDFIFWAALAEKAYAKMFGNYFLLEGGRMSEALEDFTGGVSEEIKFPSQLTPESIAEVKASILLAVSKDSFISISAKSHAMGDKATSASGIVFSHAYVIVDVEQDVKDGQGNSHFLIRARNPWGKCEWIGRWSDHDPIWNECPDKERLLTTGKADGDFDDGEFWISVEDVILNFQLMYVTHWGSGHWNLNYYKTFVAEGYWPGTVPEVDEVTSADFKTGFFTELTHSDTTDFKTGNDCTLIVDVEYRDYFKAGLDLDIPNIGYWIMKCTNDATPGDFWTKPDESFELLNNIKACQRSATGRLALAPGKYGIYPFIAKLDDESYNILRNQPGTYIWAQSDPERRPYIIRILAESASGICHAFTAEESIDYRPAGPETIAEATTENKRILEEADNLFSLVPLNPYGLKEVLEPFFSIVPGGSGLDMDAYRGFIKLVGGTVWGKVIKSESVQLYVHLHKIVGIFQSLDVKKSGVLFKEEFGNGLKKLGFTLERQVNETLEWSHADENGLYTLNEFIKAVNALSTHFGVFKRIVSLRNDMDTISFTIRRYLNSSVCGYYY